MPSFTDPNEPPSSVCPGCSEIVDFTSSVRCDLCGCCTHINCMGFAAEEVPILIRIHRRSPHLKLLCINCKGIFHSSPLSPLDSATPIEEHAFLKYIRHIVDKAIAPIYSELNVLRGILGTKGQDKPESYASKLKQQQETKVMIKPKDKQTRSKTKSDILNSVQPLTENIEIHDVKAVSNGGLVIGCSAGSHGDKLLEIAEEKLSDKYSVKKLNSVLPRVRVVGIAEGINESDVAMYLIKQNPDVICDQSVLNVHKLWTVKKNIKVYQAEISVDLDSYNRLLEKGNVLIGLNGCSIYDAVSVSRCFKCCGFGHNAKYCKNKYICAICANTHAELQCSINSDDLKKCINCVTLRERQKLDIDVNHAAFDQGKCSAYKIATAKFKQDLFGIKTNIELRKIIENENADECTPHNNSRNLN